MKKDKHKPHVLRCCVRPDVEDKGKDRSGDLDIWWYRCRNCGRMWTESKLTDGEAAGSKTGHS